jgi:hypothetical protein
LNETKGPKLKNIGHVTFRYRIFSKTVHSTTEFTAGVQQQGPGGLYFLPIRQILYMDPVISMKFGRVASVGIKSIGPIEHGQQQQNG